MNDRTRHDLNNYLASIITFAEMLVDDLPEGSRQRNFASMIRRSGLEAQKVVNPDKKAVESSKPGPIRDISRMVKGKVIVVDDQPDMREMIGVLLDGLGYESTLCADGLAALKILEESQGEYVMAIVDQTMPVMSGDELATRISQKFMGFPTILVTGYNISTLPKFIHENPAITRVVEKSGIMTQLPEALKDAMPEIRF